MDFAMIIFIIGWLSGSCLAGYVAERKGRSGPGWLFGALFLFSPLLALIALVALPVVPKAEKGGA